MPGSIDGVLGHGSKVHRGEGRCHMEDENSVDVRVVQHRLGHGSEVHKGGRWHVEDVNSVDARVVEQAIICLTLGPLWLKVQIWLWLRPSHSFFSFAFHCVLVAAEMSLADFCTDVEKADKFKERALRVFELNEIEDVCDLQYTTSDKLEAAAIQAA